MQQRLISLLIAAILLVGGMIFKVHFFPRTGRLETYYFTAYFLAVGMFFIFTGVSLSYRIFFEAPPGPGPSGPDPDNLRNAYRINYPQRKGPLLELKFPKFDVAGGQPFSVLTISENGLCFANPKDLPFEQPIQATVHFGDRYQVDITGQVVRAQEGQVSLKLLTPLPNDLIMREQRLLIAEEREEEQSALA